jgi:LPXTG-motif cell wall-anchored protein
VGGAIGAYAVLTTGLIGTALAGGAAGVATGAVTGPGAIAIGGVGIISGGAYYWWNKKKNDQIANTYMLKLRGDLVNHQAELKARLTQRLTQPLTSP